MKAWLTLRAIGSALSPAIFCPSAVSSLVCSLSVSNCLRACVVHNLQRRDDPARIVAQEILAQFDMLRPRASTRRGGKSAGQISGRFRAQCHEIYGLAPFR